MKKKEHLKVIAYTRVSTKEQAEQGVSLDDQIKQIQRYCAQHGHTIVSTYVDEGFSGREDKRPQFKKMAEDITREQIKIDAILTLTSDRYFRNWYLADHYRKHFEKKGVEVIHILEDFGKGIHANYTRDMIARNAQFVSELISERTASGMQENASQGYYNGGGGPPYGYRVIAIEEGKRTKSKLVLDEEEAKVVRRIFSIYLQEGIGFLAIAARLNDDGVLRRGKRWHSTQISRMLEDPAYIGIYATKRFSKEALEEQMEEGSVIGRVEPIVDEATFEAVQILRTSRLPIKKAGRRYDGPLALTGLVKCSYCGASLVASTANGGKQTYYCCKTYLKQTKKGCPGHRFRAELFEEQIFDAVINWAFGSENIKALVKGLKKARAEKEKPAAAIKARIKELAKILERYYAAFENGAIDAQELSERVGPHKLEKRRLEEELEQRTVMNSLPPGLENPEKMAAIREELRKFFNTVEPQTKRRLMSIIMDKIIVNGKQVTMHAKAAGIIAVFDVGKVSGEEGVARLINSHKDWQPLGGSNPCDGTENPTS